MRASAGSRTRVDCLEGNHANRYTTDACSKLWPCFGSNIDKMLLCIFGTNNLWCAIKFHVKLLNWGVMVDICVICQWIRNSIRYWPVACCAPNHYLNQHWLMQIIFLRVNFNEIWVKLQRFSFEKNHVNLLSGICQKCCSGRHSAPTHLSGLMEMPVTCQTSLTMAFGEPHESLAENVCRP